MFMTRRWRWRSRCVRDRAVDSMYRIFFRGGDYVDSAAAPALSDDVWAVVNLDILSGGDAYQALMATLQPVH